MPADTQAHWIPAAVAADILSGTVVPATLPTGPIAVWRSASGMLHANGDRCPHRGMRLSHGFVRGESLLCIYHGWRYGRDGSCEHIPAHPNLVPPKSINCGPLAVVEQNGVAWVAADDPGAAPTPLDGFEALRSVAIQAAPEAILAAGPGSWAEGSIAVRLGPCAARLLLSEREDGVLVIALLETGASVSDRLEASSALEALRRRAETREALA